MDWFFRDGWINRVLDVLDTVITTVGLALMALAALGVALSYCGMTAQL